MLLNFITAALLSTASSSFDQDREAILGMCGAFEVTFQFEEMTPVQADYKLKRPTKRPPSSGSSWLRTEVTSSVCSTSWWPTKTPAMS